MNDMVGKPLTLWMMVRPHEYEMGDEEYRYWRRLRGTGITIPLLEKYEFLEHLFRHTECPICMVGLVVVSEISETEFTGTCPECLGTWTVLRQRDPFPGDPFSEGRNVKAHWNQTPARVVDRYQDLLRRLHGQPTREG